MKKNFFRFFINFERSNPIIAVREAQRNVFCFLSSWFPLELARLARPRTSGSWVNHIKYRFAHEAKRALHVNQREQAHYTNTFRFWKLLARHDFSNASFSDTIQNILENFKIFFSKVLHFSGKLLTFATSFGPSLQGAQIRDLNIYFKPQILNLAKSARTSLWYKL